jgi:hypothetical protein
MDTNLHVARTLLSDGKIRPLIVRLEPVNDGGAYEYHDPLTGEVVGSVGRNRLSEFVMPLGDWLAENAR